MATGILKLADIRLYPYSCEHIDDSALLLDLDAVICSDDGEKFMGRYAQSAIMGCEKCCVSGSYKEYG